MKKIILALALMLPTTSHAIPIVLDDMPSYNWTAGCSPTAAAMILGYWDVNRYEDLFDASGFDEIKYTSNVRSEIFDIAGYLGTNRNGSTNADRIDGGIEQYARDKGIILDSRYMKASWNNFTYEINKGRPVLFNISTRGVGTQINHSIAAFGYEVINGIPYYASYSTWHESERIDWYRFDFNVDTNSPWSMAYVHPISAPIPEPATGLLYGAGLLGLSYASRKGHRNPRRSVI